MQSVHPEHAIAIAECRAARMAGERDIAAICLRRAAAARRRLAEDASIFRRQHGYSIFWRDRLDRRAAAPRRTRRRA